MDIKTFGHQYSEALIEAAFAKLGYFVYTNKSGKATSDLIVEDQEGFLLRVEVKSSSTIHSNSYGNYIDVQLRSVRSNKTTNIIHNFDTTGIDILAVVCTETSQIKLLNTINIDNKTSIRVYLKDMYNINDVLVE